MKRLWKILIVGLVLIAFTSGLSSGMAITAEPTPQELRLIESSTWALTCYIMGMDCSNIPRPLVVYKEIPDEEQVWGSYETGSVIVVVNDQIKGTPFSVSIVAHEYTHYIQFYQRKYQGPWASKDGECATEREAVVVGLIAAAATGFADDPRVATWEDLREQYGCKK